MILISYDGSADAQAAIDRAAQLMPGAYATVLTVWTAFMDSMARTCSPGMGLGMAGSYAYAESGEIDTLSSAAALATATEGAQRATAAGLVATPLAQAREGDIANTILAVGADIDAAVIVLGTRGLNRVKAMLLGSVSHVVVQHADRAVLVVPSAALVARRHPVERAAAPAPLTV
jgi:nucleotide-binding universal stress UspA family protein